MYLLKIHIQKFKTQRIDPTERIKLDQVGRREFHGIRGRISPAEKIHTYQRPKRLRRKMADVDSSFRTQLSTEPEGRIFPLRPKARMPNNFYIIF